MQYYCNNIHGPEIQETNLQKQMHTNFIIFFPSLLFQ